MSKTDQNKCSNLLTISFLIIFIHCCASAPVNTTENAYSQFIAELNRNKCSVPSQVQLPFDTSKLNNFEYLTSYLEICQNTESTKRSKEAVVLCKEIFDNVRNISCPMKTALPDINVSLSKNVCKDIGILKDFAPEDDKTMLKRLTDSFLCDIMCESEFEKACQVLLWSHEVQKLISSIENVQESEQSNVPEDVGDMNDKQDNTVDEGNLSQINVNSENEKTQTENFKDVKGNIGHDKILEVVEPHKLPDNPEQKPDVTSKNVEQEKPVLNNEEPGFEKQNVPDVESQDLTETPKAVNSLKTSGIEVAHYSNSNDEIKPIEDMTKGESNVQNMDKPQDNIANVPTAKHDQVSTVNRISPGFIDDEPNQNVKADKQVPDKNIEISAVEHTHYNSNIPDDEKPEAVGQNANFVHSNDLPYESGNEKSPGDEVVDLHKNEENPPTLVNKHQIITDNAEKTDTAIIGEQTSKDLNQQQAVKDLNQQIVKDVTQHQTTKNVAQQQTTKDGTQQQTTKDGTQQQTTKDGTQQQTTKDGTQQQTTKDGTQQQTTKDGTQQETTKDETQQETTKDVTQQQTTKGKIDIVSAIDKTKADQPQTNSDSRKAETQDHSKTDAVPHDLNAAVETENELTEQKKPKTAEQVEDTDNAIPDTTNDLTDQKPQENNQQSKDAAVKPGVKSSIPSSPIETSTKTTIALEKMEGDGDIQQPADEETDHYAELQNTEDEDYSRPDYDNGLYEVTKNKDLNHDIPSPMTLAKEIITSQNEKPIDFASRNSYGQETSDIQMIAAFPDQEDGHFFFYFLSVVLILMAGYLIFHNKQKIIALIVEGRHERNRRSHRIGYKKLETK